MDTLGAAAINADAPSPVEVIVCGHWQERAAERKIEEIAAMTPARRAELMLLVVRTSRSSDSQCAPSTP